MSRYDHPDIRSLQPTISRAAVIIRTLFTAACAAPVPISVVRPATRQPFATPWPSPSGVPAEPLRVTEERFIVGSGNAPNSLQVPHTTMIDCVMHVTHTGHRIGGTCQTGLAPNDGSDVGQRGSVDTKVFCNQSVQPVREGAVETNVLIPVAIQPFASTRFGVLYQSVLQGSTTRSLDDFCYGEQNTS